MTHVFSRAHDGATLFLRALEGWEVGTWNEVDLVLWDPAWRSSFRANIVISCQSTASSHDVLHLLDVAADHLRTHFDDLERRASVVLDDVGACAMAQVVLFDAGPTARRVAQLHVFIDAGGPHCHHRPSRPVFQIVGTVAAEDLAFWADDFEKLVESIVLELPARQ